MMAPSGNGRVPSLKALNRYIVADLSAQLLALAGEMELLHGDQFPIAISGRNCDAIDWGRRFIGVPGRGSREGNNGHDCNRTQAESNPLHEVPPSGWPKNRDDESRLGEPIGAHLLG